MFFGFRLGPFRVGMSSKGSIYGGVSAGPFSVSAPLTGSGRGRGGNRNQGTFFPWTLDQALAQARAEGFRVESVTPGTSATISRGWKAATITVVRGGVVVRPTVSTWTALAIFAGALAFVACCCVAPIVSSWPDDEPERTSRISAPSATRSLAPSPTAPSPTPSLSPSPTPTTAKPSPTPKRTTAKPSPTRTTTKPKPKPSTPKTDPRFDTCKEANAHGYGPYYEGEDPEYEWYQDRDGDGIVCEPA